jgi:FkbM family methyltransferase
LDGPKTFRDERGLGKRLKRRVPPSMFRAGTKAYNRLMASVPYAWKYGVGTRLRRSKAPYRFLRGDETVVQVGSARDILGAGRSRAIHFARLLPRGRVVVIEADPRNCAALREFTSRYAVRNLDLVESGAWHEEGVMVFLSSPSHPAANVLSGIKAIDDRTLEDRGYQEVHIHADTVDRILSNLGSSVPRVVSITTNGAEMEILEGMKETVANGCEYVSLASTSPDLVEQMSALGFEYIARDDRGYCFRNGSSVRGI